jgi:uncharacterized protein with GYD domain
MRGMVSTPEDRTEPVSKLVEAAGGKLLAYYMTFGEYDWLMWSKHRMPKRFQRL